MSFFDIISYFSIIRKKVWNNYRITKIVISGKFQCLIFQIPIFFFFIPFSFFIRFFSNIRLLFNNFTFCFSSSTSFSRFSRMKNLPITKFSEKTRNHHFYFLSSITEIIWHKNKIKRNLKCIFADSKFQNFNVFYKFKKINFHKWNIIMKFYIRFFS